MIGMKKNNNTVVKDFTIDRFRAGDLEEFNYVFNLFYKTINIFIFSLIKTEPEAQDLTTEGFIKLWKLRDNFQSLENIKAFLYATARNASIDFLRHMQCRRNAQKEILHLIGQEEMKKNEIIQAEVFNELSRQIDRLPNKCQEIFKMLYFRQLNTTEVANLLNISRQTVLNQKAIAIKILRTSLFKKALLPC